uniref:Uncharacterized protein n=1 Tax=Mustela putorius furo TaxID=9669 RepID=M3YSB9_MUSPF
KEIVLCLLFSEEKETDGDTHPAELQTYDSLHPSFSFCLISDVLHQFPGWILFLPSSSSGRRHHGSALLSPPSSTSPSQLDSSLWDWKVLISSHIIRTFPYFFLRQVR